MSAPIAAPLVSFRPFLPEDALAIRLQASQMIELGIERAVQSIEEARAIAASGPAWTAIGRDGRILVCAGFGETFAGVQAVAWALLAEDLGPAHLAITREAMRQIAAAPYRRIELIAAASRKPCLWALRLGFAPAHVLQNYGAASERCILFEVIRNGAE